MTSENAPDYRIGNQFYRAAEGYDEIFGLPPGRRTWRSLFAERQDTSGAPGVQSVREDDLRWLMTNFSGGEGLKVLHRGDALGQMRYFASVGIDLSIPGEMSLAKTIAQKGTGGSLTTVEASVFTDVSGTSVVSGTDRELDATDEIKTVLTAPAAGSYQVNWYAYMKAATSYEGNTLTQEGAARFVTTGSDLQIFWNGNAGLAKVTGLDLPDVLVVFTVRAKGVTSGAGPFRLPLTARLRLVPYDETDEELAAYASFELNEANGDFDSFKDYQVGIRVKAGHTYSLRAQLLTASDNNVGVQIDKLSWKPHFSNAQTLTYKVFNETSSSQVLSGSVDIASVESAGQRVALATFVANGTSNYSIRFKVTNPTRNIMADKIDYQLAAIDKSWHADLGLDGKLWMVDYNAAAAADVFYWDAANQRWTSAATLGAPVGAKCVGMDSSDSYEYFLMDDKKVYRVDTSTQVTYTAAVAETAVGLCVSANRVYILAEQAADGTKLYEVALDQTSGLPLTPTQKDQPFSKGIVPDTTLVRRMAATGGGCVYFVNHSSRCTLHAWDAGAATAYRLETMPDGFEGKAIVHSMGTTLLGGDLPAVDDTGTSRPRPVLFKMEHLSPSTVSVELLEAQPWRSGDPDTHIQDMQLYGDNLWILTQVNTSPKKLRLWRLSLRAPGGLFLEQEIITDDSQQSDAARAFALNWKTTVMLWGSGLPYIVGKDYPTSGLQYLDSPIFTWGLQEKKNLIALDLDAVIPTGTFIEVQYQLDQDGTWETAGNWTAPGRVVLVSSTDTIQFRNIQFRIILATSDITQTPTFRALDVLASMVAHDKFMDVVLLCADETQMHHVEGHQLSGSDLADYLFDLAETGQWIEFEDFFSNKDLSRSRIAIVEVRNPDQVFIHRGESIVKVRLSERSP